MSQESSQVSPIRAALTEIYLEGEGELIPLDPARLDAAIVGLVAGFGDDVGSVCYDRDLVIDILTTDGTSREEAEGFFASIMAARDGAEVPALLTSPRALMDKHQTLSVRAAINETEGSFLLMEPARMDAAIAGLVTAADKPTVVCYDRDVVIDVLMQDGMDRDEAEEFFSFNIEGAYLGEATPVYLTSTASLIERLA